MLFWFCALGFALSVLVLVRTIYIALATPRLQPDSSAATPVGAVNILVPARNEADRGLRHNISLLLSQSVPSYRLIVTDDRSTDATGQILNELQVEHPARLTVVHGTERPSGWIGKLFALHQARLRASADWIALVDADVEAHPNLLMTALAYAEQENLDALCVLPQFAYRSFWVAVVLPVMIWFSVMRVSPTQTNRAASPYAFGFGNFLLLSTRAHDNIGGFAAYRSCVLDDCEVFERLKTAGAKVCVVHGPSLLLSPMYDTLSELWGGFAKNSFAALRYSWPRLLAVLLAVVSVPVQVVAAVNSDVPLLGLGTVASLYAALAVSGLCVRAPLQYFVLLPVGILIAVAILTWSAIASTMGGVPWKGRLVK